jgi:hypothetical protein
LSSFWDWTLPETLRDGVPVILQQKQIEISILNNNDPLESATLIMANPLYTYKFWDSVTLPVGDEQEGGYFNNWCRTYRWPTNKNPDCDATMNSIPPPKENYEKIHKCVNRLILLLNI